MPLDRVHILRFRRFLLLQASPKVTTESCGTVRDFLNSEKCSYPLWVKKQYQGKLDPDASKEKSLIIFLSDESSMRF